MRNKALLMENSNPFSATDTGQILSKGDGILLTTVRPAETATVGSDRIAWQQQFHVEGSGQGCRSVGPDEPLTMALEIGNDTGSTTPFREEEEEGARDH